MKEIDELVLTMRRLRDPDTGCPWDLEQTFDTIIAYTLEEVYELVAAIESRDWPDVCGELGDLLFHIIYYAQLGDEEQKFDLCRIANDVNNKLIKRHPHVFAGTRYADRQEQKGAWERMKAEERAEKGSDQSLLDGLSKAKPAMATALDIQRRAASVGFDWDNSKAVLAKLEEEIREISECLEGDRDPASVREELGDILFTCVNLSRHVGTDPEMALRYANSKFEQRFRAVERAFEVDGRDLQQASLEDMDAAWEQAKQLL